MQIKICAVIVVQMPNKHALIENLYHTVTPTG